ncbi:MAG: hypothetical protein AB7E26_05045 [Chryseobacterium sp.]
MRRSINLNDAKMNYELIQILKKQIISGAASEYGSFDDYSEKDLQVLVNFEEQILTNNGYKKPKDKDFKLKIYEIFGRQLDNSSDAKFISMDISGKCEDELVFEPLTVQKKYIYVTKENNFITFFLPLPNIVDYLRLFPDLAAYESEPIIINTNEGQIKINQWKDIPNLVEERQKNVEALISRNKYLFNESRADFAWLKFNDKLFLESLVKNFGYVKDQQLLKFVFENNKSIEGLGKILWNEKCDGTLVFNKEVIKLIQESSTEKQEQYVDEITDYLIFESSNTASVLNDDFSKKAEILGKIAYYGEKTGKKIHKSSLCFRILIWDEEREKYEEEFKKSNYYNLPDFKELWKEAKTENEDAFLQNKSHERYSVELHENKQNASSDKDSQPKKKGFWRNLFR